MSRNNIGYRVQVLRDLIDGYQTEEIMVEQLHDSLDELLSEIGKELCKLLPRDTIDVGDDDHIKEVAIPTGEPKTSVEDNTDSEFCLCGGYKMENSEFCKDCI